MDAENVSSVTYTGAELLEKNGSFHTKAQLSIDTNQSINNDTNTNSPSIF